MKDGLWAGGVQLWREKWAWIQLDMDHVEVCALRMTKLIWALMLYQISEAIVSYERWDYRSLHQVLGRFLWECAADHRACMNNVPQAVGKEKFMDQDSLLHTSKQHSEDFWTLIRDSSTEIIWDNEEPAEGLSVSQRAKPKETWPWNWPLDGGGMSKHTGIITWLNSLQIKLHIVSMTQTTVANFIEPKRLKTPLRFSFVQIWKNSETYFKNDLDQRWKHKINKNKQKIGKIYNKDTKPRIKDKVKHPHTDLPQCVKLLSIWNGQFSCFVTVNAIMHDLSFMEDTQSVGAI